MNYKAIIFDMDGTIIDTEHIWKKATHELVTKRIPNPHPDIMHSVHEKIHGLGLEKSCQIIKDTFNIDEHITVLTQEKSKRAVQLYQQEVRFINGFTQFHEKVVKYQLKHGVATNADDATVQATDNALNLRRYFGQHIYGISCVNNVCKPDPKIYLHVATQLGIAPHECIAIEDSAHGIQAAKQAGMFCIGINTAKKLHALAQADIIIDGYHEIELEHLLFKKAK